MDADNENPGNGGKGTMIITVTLNSTVDRTLEIRNFRVGSHEKARLVALKGGGKGMNISQVLQTLGVGSVAMGFVGMNEMGLFAKLFANSLVPVQYVPTAVGGPTRLSTTILDPVNRTETHIREEGASVRKKEIEELERYLEPVVKRGDWLIFAGSLPPRFPARILKNWIEKFRKVGARVALDTSGGALKEAVRSGLDLVKINREEFGELAGKRVESEHAIRRAAKRLLERAHGVLVTLGKDGCIFVSRDGAWRARAPKVRVINTVGAGDAFFAGYLYGEQKGLRVAERLRWAIAAGSAAASSVNLSELTAKKVKSLLKKVIVSRLR